MPYIPQERRDELGRYGSPLNAGELNYRLTQVILEYLEDKKKSYQTMNDIVGALEGCKIEFYRREIAPYEDLKIKENGDVF